MSDNQDLASGLEWLFANESQNFDRIVYRPCMPNADMHTPTSIQQHDARTLAIAWVDESQSLIDVRALSLACSCALCVDEWSGEALLLPDSVPNDIAPVKVESVGRYAIQIDWSDGHDSGIYPFERLRTLSDQGALEEPGPKGTRSS